MKVKIFYAILLSFTVSCSSFKKVVEPPKIKLEEVKIKKLSALDADLEVVLDVKNPNGIDFDVKSLKYTLELNSKEIASETMKEKVVVKGKQTTVVALPIKVLYKDILTSAVKLLQKDGLPYRVQGKVEVGPFSIPFDDKGNLKHSDL
jgi:LEA14-like dessication related protein